MINDNLQTIILNLYELQKHNQTYDAEFLIAYITFTLVDFIIK